MEAILPIVAHGNVTRQQIVTTAQINGLRDNSYETADYLVVGDLGFRFNTEGRLIEVKVGSALKNTPYKAGSATSAPSQSLIYSIYSLSPLFGEQQKIAEGERVYTPEDILVTPYHHSPFATDWSKSLAISNGFSIGAEVYREAKIGGFGLSISLNGEGHSWEWFDKKDKDIFCKRQGKGHVKVRIKSIDNQEELTSIEFLDDITLRLQTDNWWQSIPFLDKDTHIVIVRKGSVLWLAP